MIRNYLKTAWRNLIKNKMYSVLNIAGLVIGITSCILIFLYVQFELSYDKYNKNSSRIYRLTEVLHLPKEDRLQGTTSPIMAPVMESNFPEIQKSVRLINSSRILSVNNKKLYDTKLVYADSTFFDIFTFPMSQGEPSQALVKPYSIVLTKAAAKKYFGYETVLGQTMQLSDTLNFTVTGVIDNVPPNSHFTFDCVLSYNTIRALSNNVVDSSWFNNSTYTFFLLPENYQPTQLEIKLDTFIHRELADRKRTSGLWYDFKLQPLTGIHLHSKTANEWTPNSDISYIYIFSAAAILILIIACCNFINLATARSLNRSKEIGLRKVVGATRWQLATQFLGESFLFAIIGGLLSLAVVMMVLPAFNNFTGKELSLNVLNNQSVMLLSGAIILAVGLFAGIYPALLMSSFAPIKSLKGVIRHGWQDIVLRKGLVVFQFTIAIVLIAGTGIVLRQLSYMQNRKIGLNKDQVIEIGLRRADLPKGELLARELGKNAGVTNVTLTDFSFKSGISNISLLPEGAADNETTSEAVISVDYNFIKTLGITMARGRDFSPSYGTDSTEGFIINEAAVKHFGWTLDNAVGKKIDWGLGKKGRVVGVVNDFNFTSLHDNIKPLIIHILPAWYRFVVMRVQPGNITGTLDNLKKTWNGIVVDSPFDYTFLDNDFANLYKEEQNMRSVLMLFTILSLIVACLGLFGLSVFMIKQRYKEIAVRKVLGASIPGITGLLSREFVLLVIISTTIAFPLSWWGMHKWLEDFPYRVNIGWGLFIIAGAITLTVALLTVSFQAIKAALTNPVKTLRAE